MLEPESDGQEYIEYYFNDNHVDRFTVNINYTTQIYEYVVM